MMMMFWLWVIVFVLSMREREREVRSFEARSPPRKFGESFVLLANGNTRNGRSRTGFGCLGSLEA